VISRAHRAVQLFLGRTHDGLAATGLNPKRLIGVGIATSPIGSPTGMHIYVTCRCRPVQTTVRQFSLSPVAFSISKAFDRGSLPAEIRVPVCFTEMVEQVQMYRGPASRSGGTLVFVSPAPRCQWGDLARGSPLSLRAQMLDDEAVLLDHSPGDQRAMTRLGVALDTEQRDGSAIW